MAKTVHKKRKFGRSEYVLVKRDGTLKSVSRKPTGLIERSGKGTIIEKRVYGADGRLKTIYTIDSGSGTFGSDLGYAFKKNVAKARRENKKTTGRADATVQE